jgi:hypothetical protein
MLGRQGGGYARTGTGMSDAGPMHIAEMASRFMFKALIYMAINPMGRLYASG